MFVHTLKQVINFHSIADKVEDNLEKAHQTSKKLYHFTSHLKTNLYKHEQNIQIKQMLLHQDNDMQQPIKAIHTSLKQRFQNAHLKVDVAKKKGKLI